MKQCPYCGRYCDDNSLTCANCGGALPPAPAAQNGNAGFTAAAGFAPAQQNNPYQQNSQYQQNNPYPQNNPYQQPMQQNGTYYGASPEVQKMPSKGLHLTLVILGFFLGIIWGALSIGPYQGMNIAIQNGDAETARQNAKKVRMFFFIGLGVNILVLFARTRLGV